MFSKLLFAGVYHIDKVFLQVVDFREKVLFDLLLHCVDFFDFLLGFLPLLLVPFLLLEVEVLQVHRNSFEVGQRLLFPVKKVDLENSHLYSRVNLAD